MKTPVLAGVVLLLILLSTTLDCRWCPKVVATAQSEPPLRFVRIGPQRHLLVLSSSNSGAVQKTRHQLQQMAANRSWFLYHTSVHSSSSVLTARALAQFNTVVLNQLPRHELTNSQMAALKRFEREGGKVTAIVGDLSRGSLE